ncbi:hypothetical protein KSS87_009130 [Heliosperma pusillum]|nr:hypothetical protein KSS87_009130 [Heliosperma pusillum]
MPLERFIVRNEYSLGGKRLYKDGVNSEDSKVMVNGIAVAGLVGLLRQLGDLSQFAAEIFHGLQEQVVSTASRSRKLVTRIQHIEAILPSLEKAMLSQTSHIHFAYTPGSEWHPRIKAQKNHFVYSDLPHFIMDSYEECRGPPRLQSLDRFDTSGPGSCLKRYTDPTFFRRASASSEARNRDKARRERKARKKKRSRQRSGQCPNSVSNMNNNGREQMSSQTGRGGSSLSHTGSTVNPISKSHSVVSKEGLGFAESLSQPGFSIQPDKTKSEEFFPNIDKNMVETSNAVSGKGIQDGLSTDTTAPRSSNVTWDEKLEIMEHKGLNSGIEDDVQFSPQKNKDRGIDLVQDLTEATFDLHEHDFVQVNSEPSPQLPNSSKGENAPQVISESFPQVKRITKFNKGVNPPKLIANGDFVSDSLDSKWSKSDTGLTNEAVETIDADHLGETTRGSIGDDNFEIDRSDSKVGIGDVQFIQETILDITKMKSEITSDKCDGCVDNFTEGVNHRENVDSETDNFVDASNTIDSETESDLEKYTRKEVKSTSICKLPDLMVKQECHSKSDKRGDGFCDGAEKAIAPFSLDNLECVENELSSKQLELATSQEQAPRDDGTACTNGSVGIPPGSTSSYPHALWTNGTLLGLQPSKPTVSSVSPSPIPVTGTAVSSGYSHSVDGKSKSSVNSPSSPPLEHMKISFRPIDRIENSRLKLKYPEEVDNHVMTVETFPSFQLVPGFTSVHHDMGSDSDDDTFCRSYPCVSDESAGHVSDSDSEQWESGDSTGSNDHALYDEPRGISSTGSSNFQCLEVQTPPLPPLEWRVSRPVLLGVENTPERGSYSPNQSFDSYPLEDDSAKLQSKMQETDTTVMQKKEIEVAVPNVDGQKQGCHATNVDECGDFLHQIRAKSFNLKRPDAARSVSTPSLPTSNKMTAILQKANAIRQLDMLCDVKPQEADRDTVLDGYNLGYILVYFSLGTTRFHRINHCTAGFCLRLYSTLDTQRPAV